MSHDVFFTSNRCFFVRGKHENANISGWSRGDIFLGVPEKQRVTISGSVEGVFFGIPALLLLTRVGASAILPPER